MSKGSHRRCRYFDRHGDSIDGGCPRPAYLCGFYHPEDEGWNTARISAGPRRGSRKRNSRRPSTPPRRDYESRRDSGYSQRRRRSFSRSRSRSPFRRIRRDSIASTVPDQTGSPRNSRASHDPRPTSLTDVSIANKGPTPSAKIPTSITFKTQQKASSSSSLINPTTSLPTPPATASQAGSLGDAPFPPSMNRGQTSPMIITSPSRPTLKLQASGSMVRSLKSEPAPPAPPKTSAPMPPPQPLPAVPAALFATVAPSTTVEQTPEEKRAMWEDRTRILADSELAREQLIGLEELYVSALQIVESQFFANLPEEDKHRLRSQLVELEKERDEAKKLHEESVDRLFKTGAWPVAPLRAVEDDVGEKHKEVVKYIQELKDTALQMSKILGDISMFKSPPLPPLFLLGDSEAMNVDQPDGHGQSRRPRRSLDRSEGSTPSPTQQELDEFLERLARMEDLLSTLENDINEHGREAREEFEQLVDMKLDEFQTAREEAEKQKLEEEQQHMQDLEQDITLTGEQVGELASEIGDLIMRVGKLEVDAKASRKGREESFEKVLEVERRLQGYISTRDADVQVIQTFEKALHAYTSQPPSPPATPLNLPPFDYIFQSLEEPMVQTLRSHLVPAIEDLRKDVENMVRTQNAELYSTLWNKMTITLKVLEMIRSKLNRGDIEPMQSLAGNVMIRGTV